MKKYLFIIVSILCALTLSSCDSLLDSVHKEGSYTSETFEWSDTQCSQAIARPYRALSDGDAVFSREMYWEQGVANDIVWGRTRSFNTLATYEYTGNESPLQVTLDKAYQHGLNSTNWIIESLLKKQSEGELTYAQKRTLGEAYFLRAQWHFIVAYHYGAPDLGVPFDRYEDEGYIIDIPVQRASVMENYSLVIEDLEKAEEILPTVEEYSSEERGRACKQSAVALMAKVYAYWATYDSSQWPNVIECVNRLENNYGRALISNFKDLFAADFSKYFNSEYCWSLPSNGGYEGSYGGVEFPGVTLENKGWGIYNGWGQIKPTQDLYEEMAKDNVDGVKNERLAVTILEYGDEFMFNGEMRRYFSASDLESGFQTNKYMQPFEPADFVAAGYVSSSGGGFPTARVNYPLIRFADCLLLRAEAYLVAGNASAAASDINKIRVRSHLTPLSGNATWTDLYHERRCELALELANDHAYDCKRWAYSGDPEIKALAIAELDSHPRVRHYADRSDPDSSYEIGPYEDYPTHLPWSNKFMTFPWPTNLLNKSAGHLENVAAWK